MTTASKVSIKSVRLNISASHTASKDELIQIEQELENTLSVLGLKPDVLECKTGSTEILIEFLSFFSEKLAAGAVAAMGGLFFNYLLKKFRSGAEENSVDTSIVAAPEFVSLDNPLAGQSPPSPTDYRNIESDYLDRFPFGLVGLSEFERLSALSNTLGQSYEKVEAKYSIKCEDEDRNVREESFSVIFENGKLVSLSKNTGLEFPKD